MKCIDQLRISRAADQELFNICRGRRSALALLVEVAHERLEIRNSYERCNTLEESLTIRVCPASRDPRPRIARAKRYGRVCEVERKRACRPVVVINGPRFIPPSIILRRGFQTSRPPAMKS